MLSPDLPPPRHHYITFYRYKPGLRIGVLPSLVMSILNEGATPLSNTYDFRLGIVDPDTLTRQLVHTSLDTDGVNQTELLPERTSWNYSVPLWSAANLCEEIHDQSDVDARDDPRVLLVPLEPAVTPGYHPCWQQGLSRMPMYTPKLSIMIRDDPTYVDLYTAALAALLSLSTIKGVCFFFLACAVSAMVIWMCERFHPGIFPGEDSYPVSIFDGFDDAFYWTVTTGTSTGYGLI